MSEAQKSALERITAVLPDLPPEKLEYLQGYADAMSDIATKQRAESEGKSKACASEDDDNDLPFC